MKRLTIFLIFSALTGSYAQKFTVEKSVVSFFSDATIEDITAVNKKSTCLLDASNGNIVFSIPIADFKFAKSLMRQHFNEKYMETEEFPKSTFEGKITGYKAGVTGAQPATATGKITIHGVTKDITVPGTIENANGKVILKGTFIAKLEDYKIIRPQILWKNLAEQVEVKIEFTLKPL